MNSVYLSIQNSYTIWDYFNYSKSKIKLIYFNEFHSKNKQDEPLIQDLLILIEYMKNIIPGENFEVMRII